MTGDDGRFSFGDVPVGPYRLTAASVSLAASHAGEIAAGGQVDEVTLRLGDSGAIVGRLVRADRVTAVEGAEVLLSYARQILHVSDEARARLMEPEVGGIVRLGTPEDFATVHLADVLARFARTYPQVALAVNCDFTVNLLDGFAKGQYDLVLFKRALLPGQGEAGPEDGGTGVWRETLVWVAGPRLVLPPDGPLPLVLAPAPDVYRRGALAALDAAGRAWRIVLTSPSLAGLQAAVRAGLGLTVLPREMVPPDLVVLGEAEHRLPVLPATAIVLYRAPGARSPAADRLGDHIVQSLEAAAARG